MDTNGDCEIQADEIIPLIDTNGNGLLEDAELADERVAWIRPIGPEGVRGLGRAACIDPTDGNVWVGLFDLRRYYKVDPDGNILDADGSGPNGYVTTTWSPYGCVVDANGNLFSASLGSSMGVINNNVDPPVATALFHGISNYGITLGNGFVYLGQTASPYRKYEIPLDATDPASGTFSVPTTSGNSTLAVSVDGNGDVVQGQNSVAKYDGATDAQVWITSSPLGGSYRGVIPDANQDIWRINLGNSSVSKFDGTTGDLITVLPVGSNPYTYSDASGSTLANTIPTGRWTVTTDGGEADAVWDEIRWNDEPQGNEPTGTSIEVEARASNTMAGLASEAYVPVTNGGNPSLTGRFLQTRAILNPSSVASPVLSDLTVSLLDDTPRCDVDANGEVDRNDIRSIMAARNSAATGPDDPRDNDGNGTINANDARQCVLQCTILVARQRLFNRLGELTDTSYVGCDSLSGSNLDRASTRNRSIEMKLSKQLVGAAALLAMAAGSVQALPDLRLSPSSQVSMGGPVQIDLEIVGLNAGGPDSLGDFDINIGFDTNVLSLSGFSLTDLLGDIGLGEAFDFSLGDNGAGSVNVAIVSNLDPDPNNGHNGFGPYLDDIQPASFVLATFDFMVDMLPVGSSTTVSIDSFVIGDGFGRPFTGPTMTSDAVIRNPAVSEPGVLALLALRVLGCLAFAARGLKARHRSKRTARGRLNHDKAFQHNNTRA